MSEEFLNIRCKALSFKLGLLATTYKMSFEQKAMPEEDKLELVRSMLDTLNEYASMLEILHAQFPKEESKSLFN